MNPDAKKKQEKRYVYLKLFGTTKALLSIAKPAAKSIASFQRRLAGLESQAPSQNLPTLFNDFPSKPAKARNVPVTVEVRASSRRAHHDMQRSNNPQPTAAKCS
jgi:hypothetical protein